LFSKLVFLSVLIHDVSVLQKRWNKGIDDLLLFQCFPLYIKAYTTLVLFCKYEHWFEE